jgi:hypothetical protein
MSIEREEMVVKDSAAVKAPDEKKDESNVTTAKFSGGDIMEFDSTWDEDWGSGELLLKTKSDNQLIARGVVLIQQYQRNRTETLRKLAQVVVSIRAKHQYKDMPDWGGNSNKCKEVIAEMYRKAGVDRDSESSMQKALRYHIGVLLRKVAPKEHLKALGYLDEPQSKRQTEKAKAGNKAMKGQGQKKEPVKASDVMDARPKNVPVRGGENPLDHLTIAMFHIEQASKLTVNDDKLPEVEKALKTIATATLGWVKKIEEKKAVNIKETAAKAASA